MIIPIEPASLIAFINDPIDQPVATCELSLTICFNDFTEARQPPPLSTRTVSKLGYLVGSFDILDYDQRVLRMILFSKLPYIRLASASVHENYGVSSVLVRGFGDNRISIVGVA